MGRTGGRAVGLVARAFSTGVDASKIKGVAFGCWDLVVKPLWAQHEQDWEMKKGIPAGTFRQLARKPGGTMRNMFDGHVGIQEGLPSLLKELSAEGIDVSSLMEEDVMTQVRNLVGSGRVNGDVRDALQCLRFEGYQTGLVCWEWPLKSSDTSTSVQKRSRSEMKRHFNVIVESKNEKLSRIDPDNYALLARRADLQPREMIYVDSRPELLEPAKVAGMYTVLCDTDTGGIKQVETLLGLPLANFAWSRDVYAKVLWTSNKDCLHQDEQ